MRGASAASSPTVGALVSSPETSYAGSLAQTAATFDTVYFDTDNMVNLISHPTRVTINTDGMYLCQVLTTWVGGAPAGEWVRTTCRHSAVGSIDWQASNTTFVATGTDNEATGIFSAAAGTWCDFTVQHSDAAARHASMQAMVIRLGPKIPGYP